MPVKADNIRHVDISEIHPTLQYFYVRLRKPSKIKNDEGWRKVQNLLPPLTRNFSYFKTYLFFVFGAIQIILLFFEYNSLYLNTCYSIIFLEKEGTFTIQVETYIPGEWRACSSATLHCNVALVINI